MHQGNHTLHMAVRRVILLAAVFSLPVGLALNPASLRESIRMNTDLWWHLSTGAWIVHHHAVPTTDPFSIVGNGRQWVAYSWLFEVSLYAFYRWLGVLGIIVYMMVMLVSIAVVVHQAISKRLGHFLGPIALTAVGLLAMGQLYSPRSWLFTILLFTIELDIVLAALADADDELARRRLWLLPMLFAVWANLHIQFVYGLALLVLAALTQHLELVATPDGAMVIRTPNRLRRTLWVVCGTSLLATLLNPYSWHIYVAILQIATDRVPFRMVNELMPPSFRSPIDYLVVIVALAGAFVLGRTTLRCRVFAVLLLVVAAMAFLRVGRDSWVVVVTALLLIAAGVAKSVPSRMPPPRLQFISAIVTAVLFIFALAKVRGVSDAQLEELIARSYPVNAASMVSQRNFPGPLFNDFEWGGYLIWRLPQLRVSMDGRTNIYGDERIERSVATWNCGGQWKADPDLAAANLVIGKADACLSSALASDPQYQLAYHDAISVVFIKAAARAPGTVEQSIDKGNRASGSSVARLPR